MTSPPVTEVGHEPSSHHIYILAPRILGEKARFALRQVIERANDLRGEAIFALGYWAGCRVSDVSHLLMEHVHVTTKAGWIHVGHKGDKWRDIDLVNEARRPLHAYLTAVAGDQEESKKKQKLREAHMCSPLNGRNSSSPKNLFGNQ